MQINKSKDSVTNISTFGDTAPPFCPGQCIAVKFVVASYEVLIDSYSAQPDNVGEAEADDVRRRAGNAVLTWLQNNSSYRLISNCEVEGCECDDNFTETKVWEGERFWRYQWSTDYLINGELGVCMHSVVVKVKLEKWRATAECIPRNGLLLPHGHDSY